MAKIKIENRFGVAPNELLKRTDISWKAKGLFVYIQSKPDDWDFAVGRLEASDGKDSTRAGINELEEHGYLERTSVRLPNGTWDNEWTLHSEPIRGGKPAMVTVAGKPPTEKPPTEKPPTENPPSNKEGNKKQVIQRNITTNVECSQLIVKSEPTELENLLIEFKRSRAKLRKPMTDKAMELLLKKLSPFTELEQIAMLEEAIEKGWQSVYPPKTENKAGKNVKVMEAIANYNFT